MNLALKPLMTLKVGIKDPIIVGETSEGLRIIATVSGGSFEGPGLSGSVLPTGSDWNAYRPSEQKMAFYARYDLRTDDGAVIGLINQGCGTVTPDVPPKLGRGEALGDGVWDVKTHVSFEAATDGRYSWLNRGAFISHVLYPDDPHLAVLNIYQVDTVKE